MKNYKVLSIILLVGAFMSCGGCKKKTENLFSIDKTGFKPNYVNTDKVDLAVLNPENKTIDSVVYFSNNIKLATKKGAEKFSFDLKDQKLGYQNLKAIVYFDGEKSEVFDKFELVSNVVPKLLKYKIVNTYPHDTLSFTEGLEFYKDTLYESTGLKGKSYFRKYDYKTGKVFKQIDLDSKYFGEGITFISGKLFQLTWEEKTGFIYNASTLKLEKTFAYDKDIEGWGMTNDGKHIYQTDKTEKIWRMNPDTQKMIDYVNVYSGSSKIQSINELEWINGKIYTNVWQKDAIAVVNPSTGAVEGILDMVGLRKLTNVTPNDFLNGIAYNPKTKTIFVTGKNWDKLFEITVSE
jgi:glutaminyl-peptide cyclotransferase